MKPGLFKRCFPAPWLSLALMALWLLLNNAFSLGQWLLALLVGVLAPWMTASLRPTPVGFKKPALAFRLFWQVGLDVLIWNWRVLRATLAPTGKLPQGGFVAVPLDMRDPNGLAALAAIMCVIPGTIWSELALDRSVLLVHIFELDNAQAEIDLIKSRYERPLMEIFE
ncbi:Na+/H+ antiporter subunit E [Roseateles oligotrophus]|uniref:Na+/H+ antiporter subunit E n=1 Tax=Roseateles oligotrophus TaxID=1769250 RepID=A0ABT2YKC8_9BURK|nr:Na+/H+ antiporter subunit E [Roseateles oligotrophus]MCV2370515.1 Na+/H+ antiporter subunit E [Roseateles oligotrophus]